MSMVLCHGCGKEIHESAVSCPHCGASRTKTSSGSGKNIGLLLTIAFILLAIVASYEIVPAYRQIEERHALSDVNSDHPAPAWLSASPEPLSPTGELANMFNLMSQHTDLQRENKLNQIKGKVVEWSLTVYEVAKDGSDYKVTTLPSNEVGTFIHITPRNSEDVAIIEALKTGSQISIKGIIEDTFLRNLVIKPAILFQPGNAKVENSQEMPVQLQFSYQPREPAVIHSPCVEKGMEEWQEQHDKEIAKYCDDLAKEGQECRITAGQDARDSDEALEKITAQCNEIR